MPTLALLLWFQSKFDSIWVFPDGYGWFQTSYSQPNQILAGCVWGLFFFRLWRMAQSDCRWFRVDGFVWLQIVLGDCRWFRAFLGGLLFLSYSSLYKKIPKQSKPIRCRIQLTKHLSNVSNTPNFLEDMKRKKFKIEPLEKGAKYTQSK